MLMVKVQRQELASWVTNMFTVAALIQESVLVQGEVLETVALVETKQMVDTFQIMETKTSRPWGIYWCNNKSNNKFSTKRLLKHYRHLSSNIKILLQGLVN